MNRYLEVRGEGALHWLGGAPTTPAQRVYATLLREPSSVALDPPRLAEVVGLSVPEFSKALFELSRHRSLTVSLDQLDHAADFRCDHTQLGMDLEQAAGTQPAMLVTDDGLCLVQRGLTEEACIEQAAVCHRGPTPQFSQVLPMHLGTHIVWLCTPADMQVTASDALLRIARRLTAMLA